MTVSEIRGSGGVYLVTGFPREVCSKKNGEMQAYWLADVCYGTLPFKPEVHGLVLGWFREGKLPGLKTRPV